MAKWQTESEKIGGGTGRTTPRERSIVKSAPKNKMFSISVCEAVAEDLKDIAAVKGLSRNAIINEALTAYIDNYYRKGK